LPLVENILTQKEGAQFFSGLDLTSFFYQIRVEPEDVPLTGTRTIYGMYECGDSLPANPRVVQPLQEQPGFTVDEAGS
jgi:hypothetical protein